ncbi:MAG: thiamine-binding protein [Persephonella sp.]|nr:MAG: thiamine-binding protein [Persephonella sp.]RUM60060.1 MAG: thiamine-binding protein [Persephonella sp.]RUM61766.1 MAG: thiamine-binding protein [Persephonella sp.]
MSVLVEFAMFPTDKGESVSSYVSRIIKMIDEEGIPYKLTPMGTVFEVENMEDALNILNKAYKQLEPDCNRVYSVVKFDIRKNKSNRLKQKIKSVEEKLGKEVQK